MKRTAAADLPTNTPASLFRQLAEPGRIISAPDFARMSATCSRLRRAQTTQLKNLETMHQAAWQNGYESGVQQAMSELLSFHRGIQHYRHNSTSPVKQLVFVTLRKILADNDPANLVAGIAEKATIECCDRLEAVTIYVHPTVVDTVENRLSAIHTPGMRIEVQSSEQFSLTACELHTAFGIVDASLDVQLDALERSARQLELGDADV